MHSANNERLEFKALCVKSIVLDALKRIEKRKDSVIDSFPRHFLLSPNATC